MGWRSAVQQFLFMVGDIIWQRCLLKMALFCGRKIFQLPLRGGPTVYAKRALAVTDIDANLFMLDIDDGSVLWDRAGLPSGTILYGAPSPAIFDNQMAVAAHGGELSLLDADNGDVIWTDSLATFNPRTPLQGLGDIRAHPVHDGGLYSL